MGVERYPQIEKLVNWRIEVKVKVRKIIEIGKKVFICLPYDVLHQTNWMWLVIFETLCKGENIHEILVNKIQLRDKGFLLIVVNDPFLFSFLQRPICYRDV